MKTQHKISLLKLDAKSIAETKKNLGQYYYIKIAFLFFGIQGFLAFILFPNIWEVKKRLIVGFLSIVSEIIYLLLFFFIKKALSSNSLNTMFFQYIFLNLGMMMNLIVIAPFIFGAYFRGSVLFDYYLYGLAGMFALALLYAIQLDCKQLINNSLNSKKNGELIVFAPDTVFWPLNKCGSVIWLPYFVGGICLIYGFTLRHGLKAEYYMTVGMLICSTIFLYSEFCYFWLWVKYCLRKLGRK